MQLEPIAHIRTELPEKFGIPRQSGLVPELSGEVIFLPQYGQKAALRGLEQFSHLWLLWGFSDMEKQAGKAFSATVRPPRLGGNTRVGVFATRSPFRPNPIGLSCVRLEEIHMDAPVRLTVSGVDMMDNTPIYDIKPYLPYADCIPQAAAGFTEQGLHHTLTVDFPQELQGKLSDAQRQIVVALLEQDPRPAYLDDPQRVYGMCYADWNIKFTVEGNVLHICAVCNRKDSEIHDKTI